MIILYVYLGLALTWGIYNAIVRVPQYPQTLGPTEKTLLYIMSIIVGTLIAPYSFYIHVKGRTKK